MAAEAGTEPRAVLFDPNGFPAPPRTPSKRRTQVGRRSRVPGLISEEDSVAISRLAVGYEPSSGILVDFVERCMGARGKKDENGKLFFRLLSSQAIDDFEGYEHAATIIRREKLSHKIMDGIVFESKATGAYPRVTSKVLWRRAKEIRNTKRKVMCLRVEVDNWLMTHKLLNTHVRPVIESPWERKHRVEEFWAVFHHRSLRKDAAHALHPGDSDEEELLLPVRVHSLDRQKPGYRLEPGAGLRWHGGDSPSGTLGRLQYDKNGRFEAPEASGVRCFRRSPTSNAAAASGMSKTTSLPSLHKPTSSANVAGWERSRANRPKTGGARAAADALPLIAPSTSRRYLKECDLRKTVPTPLSFMTGHSTKFEAVGRDLVDTELLAMLCTLQESECVEEVNLHGNARLTDRSLTPLLWQLSREPLDESLRRLDIAKCTRAGAKTVEAAAQLLEVCKNLRELDISRMAISTKYQRLFCKAVGEHPHLTSVNMADTGLGSTYVTKECMCSLLNSRSIETLNLGWNCFNAEVFTCLGKLVADNKNLRALCVDNCSASVEEVVTPISLFIEALAYDSSLTRLDIAINRIDYRAALIIEDSLHHQKKIAELNLSQNPLGVFGMRSILRLLSRNETGLMHFRTENCYSGAPEMEDHKAVGVQGKALTIDHSAGNIFHYTNPGGKYVLNLARPYDRTLLRMLYKTAERFRLPPEKAFLNVTFSTPPPKPPAKLPYNHPSKDSTGVWEVPTFGVLTVTFNVQEAVEAAVKGVHDSDFSGFLNCHFKLMRFHPGWKKVVPLFARWKELDGRVLEQYVYINALSKDFNLNLHYFEHMCKTSSSFTNETICRLSPCIPSDKAARFLSLMSAPKFCDYLWTHKQMTALLDFNIDNPTGHYKLDLEKCADFAVAERLMLLDRWEAAADLRHNRCDTSSRGNGSHFRNELYQGRPLSLRFASVAEWVLPEAAEFEFDYISNQRPAQGTQELSTALWEEILIQMYDSVCSPEEKINVLRSISHNFFISSMQMRQLIGYFRTPEQRAEVFVTLYLRIVDLYNAKLFRVRFEGQEELHNLQNRLGYASFFPFLQPENFRFSLDLSYNDQRLCASIIVALALKEKPYNIRDPEWIHKDGTRDPLTLGVPRSWEHHSKCPPDGIFKGTYVCAPEDRKFELRKQLAETFGFFHISVSENEVKWWTGLTEPPEDVLDFLEFLISRVNHVDEAFRVIDGVDGNGEITLREFEEGFPKLKCHKFRGKDERQRINNIFRYLDMGGEGSISLQEWQYLDQLWKEFDLSIREFVQFLSLTCGDDLADAFNELDSDGGGDLSLDEWLKAVTRLGYFGPAKVVFALLDTTDDGNISLDEFIVLEKYKKT